MKPVCPMCGATAGLRYCGLQDLTFGVPGTTDLYRCMNPKCRHLFVHPLPNPEELKSFYTRYSTHQQAKVATGWARRTFTRLLDVSGCVDSMTAQRQDLAYCSLARAPQGRILDFGCGAGGLLGRLGQLGWADTYGFDFDEQALATASKLLGHRRLYSNIDDLKALGLQFEYIVMNHVLEHLPDPEGTLKGLLHLLAQEGTFIIRTPNGHSFLSHIFQGRWRGFEPPRHLHLFSRQSLGNLGKRVFDTDPVLRTSNAMFYGVFSESLMPLGVRRGRLASSGLCWATRLLAPGILFLASISRRLSGVTGEELVLVLKRGKPNPALSHLV